MDFKIISNLSMFRFLKLMRYFNIPYSEYMDSKVRCCYCSLPVGGVALKTCIFKSHSLLVSCEMRAVDILINSI